LRQWPDIRKINLVYFQPLLKITAYPSGTFTLRRFHNSPCRFEPNFNS
jgi:hypothetical protein